jgi:predicted dehydrogenase
MKGKPGNIRFGVIGCGVIAFWAHLRALARVKDATLVAAADPDAAARGRAASLAHVPVYEDAAELLARADIDAVVIATPTQTHAGLAVAASRARKHFYVEKPVACDAEDARRVIEAAQQAGVIACMGFNRRFHPLFQQARSLIASGRIGPVRAVLTSFCEPTGPGGLPQWKRQRSTGGGVLLDLGSHHVDLARWLLDDEVIESEGRLASEQSEDDTAWLRLRMGRGAEVRGFFSFRAARADFLELIGERGTLRIDRHLTSLSLRGDRRFGYGVRKAWIQPDREVVGLATVRMIRPSYDPSFRHAHTAFVSAIRGGAPQIPTLADGLRSLEAILAAEDSARKLQCNAVASDR